MTLFNDDAQHQYTDDELKQVIAESTSMPGDDMTVEAEPTGEDWLSDSFKLNYLYESAVIIRGLVDKLTPADIERTQKTMANPLVKKLMGLR